MTEQELLIRLSKRTDLGVSLEELQTVLREFFAALGMHDAAREVCRLLDEKVRR